MQYENKDDNLEEIEDCRCCDVDSQQKKPEQDSEAPEEDASKLSNESTLLEKLSTSQDKNKELEQAFVRARADLENYRKRSIREKEETVRRANERLLESILPVLDNFSMGLKAVNVSQEKKDANHSNTLSGFDMILAQLEKILTEHGLDKINPQGGVFNPNLHEAVSQAPSEEVDDGNVIDVVRVGYSIRGKLLRPATVVVSSGKPTVESNS